MSCAFGCGKWLLFVFNFIFALCGLAFLIIGVLSHLKIEQVSDLLEDNTTFPSIALIVIGAIIFVIAFFGCCGAIRESHCMIVTFAVLLLTILVIQVAIGIYAFVNLNGLEENVFNKPYTAVFDKYYTNTDDRDIIDFVQSTGKCCGLNSYKDYDMRLKNSTIPWSCCDHQDSSSKAPCTFRHYQPGCLKQLVVIFKGIGTVVGGIAIGVAVVELIGIIFALCLANSIRNAERRGYHV